MENAVLKIDGYDPASGTYARGELFSPAALIQGGDIYGFTVTMEGVRLDGTPLEPVLAGVRSMHLVSAKISDYAVERYLASKLPLFSKLKVSLGNTLDIKAQVRGMELNAAFTVSMASPGVVEIKPVAFSMGPVNIMGMLLNLFSFRMDFSDNPYNLKVTGLRVAGNMLEVY